MLRGEAGNDTLRGGFGNDTIDGGAGTDTADYSDAPSDFGWGVDVNLTTGRGQTNALDTSIGLDTLTGIENVTGSAFTDTITGNAAGNRLSGAAGDDDIYGEDGNDIISGGLGNDTLTGGLGNNTFVFDTALSATANKDTITDFVALWDTIWLDNAIFTRLGAPGALNPAFLRTGAAAADANDYIVYNPSTRTLSYDVNGNAAGGSTVFAVFDVSFTPDLTSLDFRVI